MSPRRIVLLCLSALALLVAGPLATNAAAASFALEIPDLSAQGPQIEAGDSHTMPVDVKLVADDLVCPQGGVVEVQFEAIDQLPDMGLTATVQDSVLRFELPAGVIASGAGTGYEKKVATAFTMTVAPDVMPGHDSHGFGVKASYDGSIPAGCQSAGGAGAATEATAAHEIGVVYPPAVEEDNETAAGDAEDAGEVVEESAAPSLPVAVGLLGALMLLRRRK